MCLFKFRWSRINHILIFLIFAFFRFSRVIPSGVDVKGQNFLRKVSFSRENTKIAKKSFAHVSFDFRVFPSFLLENVFFVPRAPHKAKIKNRRPFKFPTFYVFERIYYFSSVFFLFWPTVRWRL